MKQTARTGPPTALELVVLAPFAALGFAAVAPVGWLLSYVSGVWWWLPGMVYLASAPLSLLRPVEMLVALFARDRQDLTGDDLSRVQGIVRNVEARAAAPHRAWIYQLERGRELNAYTSGRHTIGLTTAAIALPDPLFEALVAHELAHQWNNDTWAAGLRSWLLAPVRALARLARIGGLVFAAVGVVFGAALIPALLLACIVWLTMLPVLVMQPMTAWLQRRNELAADAVAASLGYRAELGALFIATGDRHVAAGPVLWRAILPATNGFVALGI